MPDNLLILGASARAAAFSALRAGFHPVCGDLFADADLQRVCPVTRVTSLPQGLERVARAAGPGPWLYTGAVENYPRLVDRLAGSRTLYGNSGAVLRRVRDPRRVAKVLAARGLPAIECRSTAAGLPCDGSWLRKRRRSAGGMQVQAWRGGPSNQAAARGWCFQQRIQGTSCAAIYVSAAGQARLLGATEQLLRDEFRYAGSIGPCPLDRQVEAELARLGQTLTDSFALVGVWGVDAIFNDDGIWPVEINPRYTASMEVLEWAAGQSTIGHHVAACRDAILPAASPAASAQWHGKQVVYAPVDLLITPALAGRIDRLHRDSPWPLATDLPQTGARIGRGRPICCVFATAGDRASLLEALHKRSDWVLGT